MKALRALVATCIVTAMCAALCACSQPTQNSPSSSSTSSSSSASQATQGESLIEFLEQKAPERAGQLANFDISNVAKVHCYKDEYPEIDSDDPKVVEAVYEALISTRVLGEYTKDEYVTDQMQSVSFEFKDGTSLGFTFDFGNLILDKTYYECKFSTKPYGAAASILDIR